MNNVSAAYKKEDHPHHIKINQNGINLQNEKYLSCTYKGFKFYTINIKYTSGHELNAVLDCCEVIEKSCWDAQENFHEYAKKRDLLTYVFKNDKMVAFQIASYWIFEKYFIYDLDETMVLKECRGNSLALALSAVSCRTFVLKMSRIKGVNRMTFLSLTPNIRLINLLDKLRFALRFVDTSFNPSSNLLKIHNSVLEKKNAELVHDDYPFFFKNIFPGSLKPHECSYRTSKRIHKILPPGLDLSGRGDAFLFLSCFSRAGIFPIMVVLLIKALGPKIIINKKLGLLGIKKTDPTEKYYKLNGKSFIELRKGERRVSAGNDQKPLSCGLYLKERRKINRRLVVQ